jgi:hypothetical protein
MRKKELKKILKKSLLNFKNKVDKKEKMKFSNEPITNQFNDYMFSDSTESNKQQIRNMIFRLLTLRDNLSINISDERISISSEYGLKPYKSNVNYKNSDYFHIDLINKTGYLLNYKEKRVAFRDESLYSDVVDNIKRIFEELNNKNFEDLYSEVMVESGLARDSNLDDLLKS